MLWLADQFGIDRLLSASVVLPTDEFFPEDYYGSPHDAERIMQRLCGFMQVDPGPLSFEVLPDKQMPGAAGHYDHERRKTIRVAESQLEDPERLTATIAHELAHELLLGSGRMTGDESDHEWLTDLLAVYLGLGLFLANAGLRESSEKSGTWHSWGMSRQGYLPARMIGYALALFAWVRKQENPSWSRFLRTDAAVPLRGGLRFLRKTNDSLFRPDAIVGPRQALSEHELVERVRSGTPTLKMAALWELRQCAAPSAETTLAVVRSLSDRHPEIRQEAARTLGMLGAPHTSRGAEIASAEPKLFKMLRDSREGARQAAAFALGRLQIEPRRAVEELALLLEDPVGEVVDEAAHALAAFGPAAEPAMQEMLNALRKALIKCDYALIERLLAALRSATPDAPARMAEYFEKRDPELLEQAIQMFAEPRTSGFPA
jgi:hypothetical protein